MDWKTEFPELSKFTKSKFYKIAPPIMLGVYFFPLIGGTIYCPYFVISPLWMKDLSSCLKSMIQISVILDEKNKQFWISLEDFSNNSTSVKAGIKQLTAIPLEGSIPFESISIYIEKLKLSPMNRLDTTEKIHLNESLFMVGLYLDNEEIQNNALAMIESERVNINSDHFEKVYGDFETWFAEVKDRRNHRDLYVENVKRNLGDKKLKKIFRTEIIIP